MKQALLKKENIALKIAEKFTAQTPKCEHYVCDFVAIYVAR
jgi:hypothetical protein